MYSKITSVLLLLCSTSAFAQVKVDVQPFSAITAKTVQVEQLTDSVAVMLTDRTPGERTGAFLTIASEFKWATPYIDAAGVELSQSKADPKRWILFAPPGSYRVQVIEFDPERGPRFNPINVTIGKPSAPVDPPPPNPVDPQPPVGDFEQLAVLADQQADKLADPETRKDLAASYESAIKSAAGKDYVQARELVTMARFAALNRRRGESRAKDWQGVFLAPVDQAIGSLVGAGDAVAYVKAISAIKAGLER